MYVKFVPQNNAGTPEGAPAVIATTVECARYEVAYWADSDGLSKRVTVTVWERPVPSDKNPGMEFQLVDSGDSLFVMNADGKTIDKINGPVSG